MKITKETLHKLSYKSLLKIDPSQEDICIKNLNNILAIFDNIYNLEIDKKKIISEKTVSLRKDVVTEKFPDNTPSSNLNAENYYDVPKIIE